MDKYVEADAVQHIFGDFFSQCDSVVGSEANYQVMLAAELERYFPGRVRREHRLKATGRGGVDVVVLDKDGGLDYAFELKGGAYNSRNALQDVFSTTGNCSDMQRLARIEISPEKRWLVAVDAIELGRSLPYRQQQNAAEAAANAGVSFAYFGHGDQSYLLSRPGAKIRYPSVEAEKRRKGRPVDLDGLLDPGLISSELTEATKAVELEADLVSRIYSALLREGYAADQIALEAYFGFAPGDMHQRPDLCVFEPEVAGHFNLYPRGNVALSNDALKLETLRVVMEVKGGVPLLRKRNQTLTGVYLGDIEKLGRWRAIIDHESTKVGISAPDRAFVFIGADLRSVPLDTGNLAMLSAEARRLGVHFSYVHIPIGT
jgi:hypothetical protein